MIQLLKEMGRIIYELALAVGTLASKFFRMTIAILAIWPVLMIPCSLLPYHFAVIVTPIAAFIPLFAIVVLAIILFNPLAFAILAAAYLTSIGRSALLLLCAIIGAELTIGVYFASVPVSHARGLVPLFVLASTAYGFLWLSGRAKLVQKLLLTLMVILTLVFIFKGTGALWNKAESVLASELPARQSNASTPGPKPSPDSPEQVAIPKPVTPPQPAKSPATAASRLSETSADPDQAQAQVPEQVTEQECPLPAPIEYGDFSVTVTRCETRGNQVRLSGKIQYDGSEKVNLSFHPFKMYDDAGNIYVVQSARFGSSENFGVGHSGQWMYPHTFIAFSLNVGPKDGSLPPATAATLIMPCSDLLGGQVLLNLALKQ
ncbi:MAG TPA: hypothetical protein VMR99_02935 [Candidatus Paceibacterota bacterium]|nr:hypothetical protein [Candidatus Paceibacterota bacterium]